MKSKIEKQEHGEFFTPVNHTQILINRLDNQTILKETFIDRNMGSGNWLKTIVDKKIELGCDKQKAIQQVFGAELQEMNTIEAIRRIYGKGYIKEATIPKELKGDGLSKMFTHNGTLVTNLVMADALKYTWNFGKKFAPKNIGNPSLFEF